MRASQEVSSKMKFVYSNNIINKFPNDNGEAVRPPRYGQTKTWQIMFRQWVMRRPNNGSNTIVALSLTTTHYQPTL